jgi:ATP-dependent Clp protease ATP-binding subunit ClpA
MTTRLLDTKRQSTKAQTLAARFALRIVGQSEATEALSAILEKFQSGFYDRTKPIGSLLFLGPTGVGKTGVGEAFAEGLFGDPKKMLKVDCAEFQHSHEIAKLVGSPPGYLGHRETHAFFTNASLLAARSEPTAPSYAGSTLGKEIMPFTVVMFDEIEKASDALWNLLLGILDKGTLTTGTNELVDFSNTVVIMTSNVGSAELASGDDAIGFDTGAKVMSDTQMKETAMAAARRKFMPEFLNRLDKVVVFKSLTPEDLNGILTLEIDKLWDRVASHSPVQFEFDVSPAALKQLLAEGYDKRYNARNLKRVLDEHVTLPLGRLVSTGQVMPGELLIIDYAGEEWKYYAESAKNIVGAATGNL